MRVTPGMTADNALYNLQQGRSKLDRLQEQVASGFVINRPSDDPISTRQLLDLQGAVTDGDQYVSNIQKGNLWLNVTNTALDDMSAVMKQAKKIAADMVNGNSDPNSINNATATLAELKKQLIDLGNSQLGNQYVFGGFKNSSPPFDPSGTFGGTDDAVNMEISKGVQVAMNISGGKLLRGGSPPAAVGAGATAGNRPTDMLGSIDALMLAINPGYPAPSTPPAAAVNVTVVQDAIKNLKSAAEQINDAQATVAGKLTRLDNANSMIANNQNMLKNIIANKQNVDYARAATELSQQKTAFDAALSTTAKISQLSLLDYIK